MASRHGDMDLAALEALPGHRWHGGKRSGIGQDRRQMALGADMHDDEQRGRKIRLDIPYQAPQGFETATGTAYDDDVAGGGVAFAMLASSVDVNARAIQCVP
jgi:hypothetical protein